MMCGMCESHVNDTVTILFPLFMRSTPRTKIAKL